MTTNHQNSDYYYTYVSGLSVFVILHTVLFSVNFAFITFVIFYVVISIVGIAIPDCCFQSRDSELRIL